jgi:hypothetical protein
VPAYAASLAEIERVSKIYSVVVISLFLDRMEELTALIGRAHSVDKVVKLFYYSKLSKLLKLVLWRCSSKLLLSLAHPVTV